MKESLITKDNETLKPEDLLKLYKDIEIEKTKLQKKYEAKVTWLLVKEGRSRDEILQSMKVS